MAVSGNGPRGRRGTELRWISPGSYQAKPRAQMLDGRRNRLQHRVVDSKAQANRVAWEAASQKYVREYGDLLAQAASGSSLTDTERDLLREILRCSPQVVHLQSGHGLDDVALVQAGAEYVVGIDLSGLKNAVLPRARHQGQTRSAWPRNCPMVRVQHGGNGPANHNRTAAVVFYGAGSLLEERRAGDLQRSGTACPPWYGNWYGVKEGDDHSRRGPAGTDPRPRGGGNGAQRFRIRAARCRRLLG